MTVAAVLFCAGAMFTGAFRSLVPVTLSSDRAGLVMESGGKVKMRGVEVGRVGSVNGRGDSVELQLELYPTELQRIPANVGAEIRATTAFGAKYVDLIPPEQPAADRLRAGQIIQSRNVATEVNTVFQNLTALLEDIDPAKLNAVLSATAQGLRGQAVTMGQGITDANAVLQEINPRAKTLREDFQSIAGFGDTYSAAAQNVLKVLDAASTTSRTVIDNATALDQLLLSVTGFSSAGQDVLAESKDDLITGVNALESTTSLLLKYNPSLTCTLVGTHLVLLPESEGGFGYPDVLGGTDGATNTLDVGLLLGDDPYRFPQHLPVVGAKGGPGGKPSCGSLPDVSKNFPQRYLVTDTGWGTGMDVRPNPGIGFPGYANFLPGTRAIPEPPSLRNPGGPAPGPDPGPGGAPYGAPRYAPDGTQLFPNVPPPPPPGAPREPGPTPGSEPFVVPHPMELQPTPTLPSPAPPGS